MSLGYDYKTRHNKNHNYIKYMYDVLYTEGNIIIYVYIIIKYNYVKTCHSCGVLAMMQSVDKNTSSV